MNRPCGSRVSSGRWIAGVATRRPSGEGPHNRRFADGPHPIFFRPCMPLNPQAPASPPCFFYCPMAALPPAMAAIQELGRAASDDPVLSGPFALRGCGRQARSVPDRTRVTLTAGCSRCFGSEIRRTRTGRPVTRRCWRQRRSCQSMGSGPTCHANFFCSYHTLQSIQVKSSIYRQGTIHASVRVPD